MGVTWLRYRRGRRVPQADGWLGWGGWGVGPGRNRGYQAEARRRSRPQFQVTADRVQPLRHPAQPAPAAAWGRRAVAVVADHQGQSLVVAAEADVAVARARVTDHVRDRLAQAPGQRRLGERVQGAGLEREVGAV